MGQRHKLHIALLVSAVASALASGCSTPRPQVRVPPRVDLARLGTLGLVDFASPGNEVTGTLATREFLAALQSAQPGTPVLELGDQRQLLAELGRTALDADAVRAIGEKHHVDALILGTLDSQRVSPKVALDPSAVFASASAQLQGSLDTRIVDTRSGATVWSNAARARAEIAGADLTSRGLSNVTTNSPDDARETLVTRLVNHATADFWARWE
ncbi:MAG: hypothetical protein ACHQ6T_14715 [Myxococcota bacterium]